MLPVEACVNRPEWYFEMFCNFSSGKLSRNIEALNFSNHAVGIDGVMMVISEQLPAPIFGVHVFDVVRFCAKKKMSRINTHPIVTAMKNAKAFIKRAVCDFICNPSCDEMLSFEHQRRPSVSGDTARPFPAFRRCSLYYFLPKSISNRLPVFSVSDFGNSFTMGRIMSEVLRICHTGILPSYPERCQ